MVVKAAKRMTDRGKTMQMMRLAILLGALAGCAPPTHLQDTTGFGPGATGYGAPAAPYVGQTAYGPVTGLPGTQQATGPIPSSEINAALFGTQTAPGAVPAAPAATLAPLPGTAPLPAGTATAALPAPVTGTAGISDEQDFNAVSARETIESDKARIEANKSQYVQIQPGALPERPGEAVSPVVAYVLNAPNGLGQSMYNRRSVDPDAHAAACQRFPTEEAAQEAFLKAGGPERDPKKLDPDGDGYACRFDPTPFRQGGN
jgi:hypothetical protein